MIILEPLGGLANRMRVVASGIWLSKKLQTKLIIIWNENHELNCPYALLFEETGLFLIKKKQRKYRYVIGTNQITQNSLRKHIINKLLGIDFCIQEPDFGNLIWTNKLDIYETARKNRVTYIQTCQEFGDNRFAFQTFKPIASLVRSADRIASSFSKFTIGVHIRRTDNNYATEYSPTELFIQRMKDELALKSETNFFLCTDDPVTETKLEGLFEGRIITQKKSLERQTISGMQDALVDMYCLSKTSKILGSYWSSFSDIASRLNNVPLEIIKRTPSE